MDRRCSDQADGLRSKSATKLTNIEAKPVTSILFPA
jgi:hypothetical protein